MTRDAPVIESNGFNDRTWLDFDGHPHSESLRMTERYRRRDVGHIAAEGQTKGVRRKEAGR